TNKQSWWQKLSGGVKALIIGGPLGILAGLGIYFAPEIAGFFGISSEFLSGFRTLEATRTLGNEEGALEVFEESQVVDGMVDEEPTGHEREGPYRRGAFESQVKRPSQSNRFSNPSQEKQIPGRDITNSQRHARWLKGRSAWERWFSRTNSKPGAYKVKEI